MDTTISLCMIAKNEEQNIARCLQSVHGAVDEIIVVDTGSTDNTVEIARRFGAKVQFFSWNDNFADARNASLALATGNWILLLDADEALTANSAAILRQIVADSTIDGYFIKINNYVGNESCPECCPDIVFRLFRNHPDYRFHGAVHEQIVDIIQERNSQAQFQPTEDVVILHYGYLDQQVKEKDKKSRNLSLIKQEVDLHPDSRAVRYHYGVELFRVGQYEAAIREFLLVAQGLDSGAIGLPKILRYIVMSYHGAGNRTQALDMVRIGIELLPDYADLYYYGGIVSYEAKDYGMAYTCLEKCLTLPEQPTHYASFSGTRGFRACFYLGLLAEKFGNEEEALRYYILGLRDNPLFSPTLESITRILKPREDPAYTRSALDKLCEFCTPQAYQLIAQILIGQGAYGLALEYYEHGMPEHKGPSRDALNQASCLIQKERYVEALRLLDLFSPSDPLYPVARINILLCFWFQGNGHIVNMLADQLSALGLTVDTGSVIDLLKDISGERKSCSVLLGQDGMILLLDILVRTLDLARWEYGSELLKHLDSTCLREHGLTIGRLWERYGRLKEARHYVQLYLDAHPDCAEAYGTLAGLLRQTAESPLDAASCYQQAITLEPREPEYYCKLIDLHKTAGRNLLEEATKRFSAAACLMTPPEEADNKK